ncbi:EAL domain-containing protein [Derxia gummosa]|uniref:EAL domain-containing protein n=1 Tax=Derxia gummosa DSM 723 TaxID=1121388 RepID=A0A8B6XB94_9BURK|nr:EAL domain-containing protein [Derxia gummosa]
MSSPKLVPLSPTQTMLSDRRAPHEVSPAQAPFVQAVLDWIDRPIACLDSAGRLRFANDAFAAYTGLARGALAGLPIDEALAGSPAATLAPLARAMASGGSHRERASQAGFSLRIERDADGLVCGCILLGPEILPAGGDADTRSAADLGAPVAADLAAPVAGGVHAQLDALPLAVAYLDRERRVVSGNRQGQLLFAGPVGGEIAGRIDQAFTGHAVAFEHLVPQAGSEPRWMRITLMPDLAGDEVAGVHGIALDVHGERLARSEIESRELRVRQFIDNVPLAIAWLDDQHRIGVANRAFSNAFGRDAASTMGRPIADLLGEPMGADLDAALARLQRGLSYVDERLLPIFTLPGSEAAPRWVEVRWLPDFDHGGALGFGARPRGSYLIFRDVHETRQARAAYDASVAELQRAMNSIGTPIALFDTDSRLRFANASLCELLGQGRCDADIGKPADELLPAEVLTIVAPMLARAREGFEVSTERELPLSDGSRRWWRLRFVPQRGLDGAVSGVYIVLFDVDDLKGQQRELQLSQEELRRANSLLSSHLDNSPLAALELNADLAITRWTERAERLFGWNRELVQGRSVWDLEMVGLGEVDAITRSFALVLSGLQQRVSALQRVTRADGSRIWCEWYISALADETGAVTSIFALVQDVNQRVEAEARLQQLAAFDSLTGLPNRSSLQFELAQALDRARRTGHGVAALFIDLDHFKNVNDTLGHRVGDQLLLAVARILKSCVRKSDTVSRMGGDEFMVVIEHPKVRPAAQHIANKVLAALNQPIPVEGHMLTVAGSVGIAVFPEHGQDANQLLKNADVAMYHAKERGKGRFEFYSEDLAREHEEQSLIEFSLRVAMATNQLRLHYQPRVNVADGYIEGAEALLRWTHPELGEVPPKKFIRVAEETGLIFDLGIWVFRRACEQLREWQRAGIDFGNISVNFSARQLLMRDLIDRISTILVETGADPHWLEVEVTETSMLYDVALTKKVIAALKRLGMRIAIDDFGTGFSSLSHLQQLEVDALKVDQSFVRDLLHDTGDAAITRAVISLGRGIGLHVIAEGVENRAQLAFLRECGCDAYQGYLFSPAVPAETFAGMLREQMSLGRRLSAPSGARGH